MSQYPDPEQINLPEPDEVSPDQSYYVGWLVQHNRLWLAVMALGALSVLLAVLLVLQTVKYEPKVQYVTFPSGLPMVYNPEGDIAIDGVEYNPARLRSVVFQFVRNRYEYDYQNLQKLNSALALMSAEAAAEEQEKIARLDPRTSISGVELKADLAIDEVAMEVRAQGNGRFEVTIPGTVSINDAQRYPDPRNPFVKEFQIELVVRKVPATDTNPLGYVIISTGRDIL